MEIREGEALDEGERGGVILLGLTREAGDDIGADGSVRKKFADEFDAAGIVFRAIPAVHSREDAVGTGLQRHVEVTRKAIGRGEKFDEVAGNVEGLDGANTQAFDGSPIQDAAEKVNEFETRGEIAPPSAEVDAAEDDLAKTGYAKATEFFENLAKGEAARFATNERNHAERTTGVAAILNFESGASVIPFSTENGSHKYFRLSEDVAGEDGRVMTGESLRLKT